MKSKQDFHKKRETIRFKLFADVEKLVDIIGASFLDIKKEKIFVACPDSAQRCYVNLSTQRFRCGSLEGDIFDFFMFLWGVDFGKAFGRLAGATKTSLSSRGRKKKFFSNRPRRLRV